MTDFDDDEDNGTDLPASLRKQIRERDKELKAARERLEALESKDRTRSLQDTLKARNVSDKLAKFYPSDKDTTEENINAWLAEHADVFGLKLDAPPADEPPAPVVPDGMQRLQNISTPSQTEGGDAAILHQINSAATAEELTALIMGAGGGAVR